MASTITERVNGVVNGVTVATGQGIISTEDVAGTDTVTATAVPAINGYTRDQSFYIRPANLNGGPVDVNIGGGGLLNLLKPAGTELAAGEFDPALEYLIKFNGTEFRIIAPSF